MIAKIENVFSRLQTGDALVDKTGARWIVHSWDGALQLNLIPPEDYRLKKMCVGLGFFGNEEDPCLISTETGGAIGAFLGLPEIEIQFEGLNPKCPVSPDNWENETGA